MKITKADVVREALILLDEVGLDGLSTRSLATRLGVQQPAIYWHFKGKRELMDAMNAEIMRALHSARHADAADDWRSYLVRHSLGFRQALLAFRDGARVHSGSRAEASDEDAAERQLEFLASQGFAPGVALRMLITLSRFTVGFVLEEQAEADHRPVLSSDGPDKRPLLAAAFEDYISASQDALFRDGLNAITEGFDRAYGQMRVG